MKHRILLGLTGSVASILYQKLIEQLGTIGIVDVIITDKTKAFINFPQVCDSLEKVGGVLYTDEDEWMWRNDTNGLTKKWNKNDPILHIELRNKASALVIAPCSANTLAKISNGICDNLLTTVARAWDLNRPFIIAPSMNSAMWFHPITLEHVNKFISFGENNIVINPICKKLACGTAGIGAMADIESIVGSLKRQLTWAFPLKSPNFVGIPVGNHPGAFATQRKYEKHTGVDLYSYDGAMVHAVENGTVVAIEKFTGEQDNSPWWNNTECILVEGPSGVVCYGEVKPRSSIKVGDTVTRHQWIASVKQVLKDGKQRLDIPGHSVSMLHMELYPHGTVKPSNGFDENILHDPTPFLLKSIGSPGKL